MTAALLDPVSTTVRDPDALFEIIDDQVVELPPMGTRSELVANELGYFLARFVKERALGVAVVEAIFVISLKRKRRPDIAFVSNARLPLDAEIPDEAAWNVIPNLVVEVISPNDLFYEVMTKLREYFQAGVEQAWVVVQSERAVYVFSSLTTVVGFGETETLDGGSILPGFRVSVADIFPKIARGS